MCSAQSLRCACHQMHLVLCRSQPSWRSASSAVLPACPVGDTQPFEQTLQQKQDVLDALQRHDLLKKFASMAADGAATEEKLHKADRNPALSGISIETHYRAAFYFLHSGVLTHDGEWQLTQRLRHQNRETADPFVYAYIQPGRPDSHQSDLALVSRSFTVETHVPSVDARRLRHIPSRERRMHDAWSDTNCDDPRREALP